jgi:hypothetical protein
MRRRGREEGRGRGEGRRRGRRERKREREREMLRGAKNDVCPQSSCTKGKGPVLHLFWLGRAKQKKRVITRTKKDTVGGTHTLPLCQLLLPERHECF